MTIETSGNQIRQAKGMKASILVEDIDLHATSESAGTIGTLLVNVTWSSIGIGQTIRDRLTRLGKQVSDVKTDPRRGTITLDGPRGSIDIRPVVADGKLSLLAATLTGPGMMLPRETVQGALDAVASPLTTGLPLRIEVSSIAVTADGVSAQWSTHSAQIPRRDRDRPDRCLQLAL